MKLKKIFGVATLAATVGTTGVIGGLVSQVSPVIAAPENSKLSFNENNQNDINVAVTKSLATAEGATDLPNLSYTFEFNPMDQDDVLIGGAGSTDTQKSMPAADCPNIGTRTAAVLPSIAKEYDPSATYDASNPRPGLGGTTLKKTENGIDYYKSETTNFLKDPATNTLYEFPTEGIYAYEVTETATAVYADGSGKTWTDVTVPKDAQGNYTQDGFNETLNMSKAKYRLLVYVKNKENGQGTYIYAITAAQLVSDSGETLTDVPKKDPTSGGSTNIAGDLSHMEFQNSLIKEQVIVNNPGAAMYYVQKEVQGVNNDQDVLFGADRDTFKFQVKMTRSALAPATETEYTAYVWTQSTSGGTSWTKGTTKYTFDATGKTSTEVVLGHNDRLVFETLPEGTKFLVQENDYNQDWTQVTKPAEIKSDYTYVPYVNKGATSTVLSQGTVKTDGSEVSYYQNNGGEGITPTGILMNNLPFFIIIAGAVAVLIVGVVVKGSRKKDTVQ